MAKSIKVNPNILECNDFTIDKLKKLVVPQGCFCYPGKTCNKVLNSGKRVVPGGINCNIELDDLVQFSLTDKKLYFSTSRIAVIVVRSHMKEDKSEKMINQGSTYPLHFTYLNKSVVRKAPKVSSRKASKKKRKSSKKPVSSGNKITSEIAQLDVKFIYSLFVKGYTPLLIFEDGETWMPFMERAQIINAALHKKHEDNLCGLPMNAAFLSEYKKEEETDEEEISTEIKDIEAILEGKPVVPNYDVDPLGEKGLRELALAEKQLLGGDPANAMSLLYRDSEIAKELGQPGYKPFIPGTNNDLRTYDEYKQINASWKSGFSEGLGGEGLWAEENLVNTASNLTGIAPILFDSGLFSNVNRHADPCETGLVSLSRIISSNVEYRNPANPDHVLKFTLLNYTGGHYNGILFKYRTGNDSMEDTASDDELRWRSVVNDFNSLPDSLKQTIFMNFFIIPMKDKSKIETMGAVYPTFNKDDFDEDGNYTGVMFSEFDPSSVDGILEVIKGLGIDQDELETDGITPQEWFDVVLAKIDGLQSRLKIVSNAVSSQKDLDNAQDALSKMSKRVKTNSTRIPSVVPRNTLTQSTRKAKLESDIAMLTRKLAGLQLQEDEDHTYHGKGITGSLVTDLGPDKVFRILNTIPNHTSIRGVNDKVYIAPRLAWMHLSDLVESRGELARNSRLVEVAQNEPEVLQDIKDLLEEVNVRACPLARNRFSNIRADEDDASVTVKTLATEFYENVILNRIADQEGIDDSNDWFNEAMEFWCNMSEYERIKYYMEYIFEASSYPQEVDYEGETVEDIDDRIYQDFMSCGDLNDDVGWVGRYLNQPDFYRVHYSPGDGNCFFWSLAQALYFTQENETVKDGKRDVWESLAQQLRYDTAQTITREMYDSKVEILSMYQNMRAVQSLQRKLGVLRPKLRKIKGSKGVDPIAQHRFDSIENILDNLNETRATAFQPILFNNSLFIATDPSDIIGRKAPKGMRVVKYYDQGIRKNIRASHKVFENESRLLTSLSEKASIVGDEEFGCFGLMSPALVDTLGVVFEESDEEESDEFELCSSAEDEVQCGELSSAGSPCYWDFEEETCSSYE